MKFVGKGKKWLAAATICAVAVLTVVLTGLWVADIPETLPINLTFEMNKFEGLDNEVGIVQICIKGTRYDYARKDDRYELVIAPFDCYKNIERKEIAYFVSNQRGCISFSAYNTEKECNETLRLHFTDELDRLIIQCRGETYYVGSVNGTYTAQECIAYYQGLLGDEDYAVSYPIDLTVNAVKMNKNGEELGTVQLHINGFYQENLFAKDTVFLEFDDFDRYIYIKTANKTIISFIETQNGKSIVTLMIGAGEFPGYDMAGFNLVFSEEFDRFYLQSHTLEYYIGSVSGNYTAYEIVEYFNSFWVTGINLPEK